MKKIIILVLLLSMFLFSLCGCGNLITDFSSYADANSYTTGGGSVSADDINEICVNWVYGSVKIEGSDTDKITFSEVSSLDSGKDSIGEATENKELNPSTADANVTAPVIIAFASALCAVILVLSKKMRRVK